jgi:hypothetical protein
MTGAQRTSRAKACWIINDVGPREVVAFCPGCKTMETLSLNSEGMARTRRFTQRGDEVYHACGSGMSCRLYSLS